MSIALNAFEEKDNPFFFCQENDDIDESDLAFITKGIKKYSFNKRSYRKGGPSNNCNNNNYPSSNFKGKANQGVNKKQNDKCFDSIQDKVKNKILGSLWHWNDVYSKLKNVISNYWEDYIKVFMYGGKWELIFENKICVLITEH